jgi:hypothetical protein
LRGNLTSSQPFAQRLFTRDEARRIAANIAKLLLWRWLKER